MYMCLMAAEDSLNLKIRVNYLTEISGRKEVSA